MPYPENSQGSGSSIATLQTVFNNSTPPEIVTDVAHGALTVRRGSAADTDTVIEVQNGAGATVAKITGEGKANFSDMVGIGTQGAATGSLDISAVTYNIGTVSVAGTAVTGTSTAFTKTFKVGDSISTVTSSGNETKEIQTISSDTALTTVSAFAGTSTNTAYTSSNSGAQFVILPSGSIRGMGTTGLSANNVSDWLYKGDVVNFTGTQAFAAFRDRTTYNQIGSAAGTINGFAAGPNLNATGTGSFSAVRGINSFPTVLATNTGNITTLTGVMCAPQITSGATGTIGTIFGVSVLGTNSSTVNTVTNWFGVLVNPIQGGGTLTNYSGVNIAAKPTAATNSSLLLLGQTTIPSGNYSIYNASTAINYMAGSVLVGTATDDGTSKLQVNGQILFAGGEKSTGKDVVATDSLTSASPTARRTYYTGAAGASFAVTFPAGSSSIDGLLMTILSTAARASTTWASSGATFVGAPTSLSAGVPVSFQYHHATTQWFITH